MTGAHTDSEYTCIFNVKKTLNIKNTVKVSPVINVLIS